MIPAPRLGSYLNAPIEWSFAFEMYFLFEIDVAAIDLPMPRGVYPLEVRPGVGLVGIGTYIADAGNLGCLPALHEIGWTVAIESDLSRDMPTPRFSFVVGNVASACAPFLEHANRVDKMPIHHMPSLTGTFDPDAFSVSFHDDQGPILTMKSTHRMAPDFHDRTLWGQQVSLQGGAEWFQAWSWKGSVFEHQQGHRAAKIHPHPLFRGIDVDGLGDRCYLQMIAEPRTPITVTFYEPAPFRRVKVR